MKRIVSRPAEEGMRESEEAAREMSAELSSLMMHSVFLALDAASRANPFLPLLTVEADGKRKTCMLIDSIEDPGKTLEILRKARGAIAKLPNQVVRYAIVTEQTMILEGRQYEAAVVEAGERGEPGGYVLVQPFRRDRAGGFPEEIETPEVLLDAADNCFESVSEQE
ncbi:MAG: hypothetical protein K8T91_20760 [Planctomycetes bacterium]|nr:hypothetical protein [Planctomycetota bacterium]